MSDSKKPEIIKTLAKDLVKDDVIQVPAERAKITKIEPMSKSMPTMAKGILKVEVEMVSGINKGNKTAFVTKEDDKLDKIPQNTNWADYIKGALGATLFLALGSLCIALFTDVSLPL